LFFVQPIERFAKLVLAARKRIKRDRAYLESCENAMMMEIAKTKKLSVKLHGVEFYAAPAEQYGSPSQRKKWRQNAPAGASAAWLRPRELQVRYHGGVE
jgi:hypothetical protein